MQKDLIRRVRWCVTVLALNILVCTTGCGGREEPVEDALDVAPTVNPYGEIELNEVRTPDYRDDFATLSVNDNDTVVYWGDDDFRGCAIMWGESGYPGFDYPMIVELNAATCEVGTVAKIATQWGVFVYECVGSGEAFKDNSNLVDKGTGEFLVNWGKMGEVLILWNPNDKRYSQFELKEGTEIVTQKD